MQNSAQACVSAVLSDFSANGENGEILDNILNCPCMERCFNGAPCRTKGDYFDFARRNTHQERDDVFYLFKNNTNIFIKLFIQTPKKIFTHLWMLNRFWLKESRFQSQWPSFGAMSLKVAQLIRVKNRYFCRKGYIM